MILKLLKISQSEPSLIKSYSKNTKMSYLRLISGLVNNPNFHKIYLTNYNDSKYKKIVTYNFLCLLRILKILESKTSQKKSYSENAKMTLLKLISGLVTSLVFHGLYIQKYRNIILKFLPPIL
jgi:hypothetical protein